MLVKNLPAGTTTEELQEVFSKHGTLGRVLLPPSGVTAIVEYLAQTEARTGFTRLAYTKVVLEFTFYKGSNFLMENALKFHTPKL